MEDKFILMFRSESELNGEDERTVMMMMSGLRFFARFCFNLSGFECNCMLCKQFHYDRSLFSRFSNSILHVVRPMMLAAERSEANHYLCMTDKVNCYKSRS